tara:strand:+ start:17014 stop:17337 length:324 start_codon:yes stop_codon:yes gene_type:complete
MSVSNKMVQKFTNLLYGYLGKTANEKVREEITQQIVNAAWTEFDFTDLSEIEQNKPYLIMHRYGVSDARLEDWEGDISWHNDEGLPFGEVTHYADPNDLLYVRKDMP